MIRTLKTLSLAVTPVVTPFLSLCSCSKTIFVTDSISLSATATCLKPGQTSRVMALDNKSKTRIKEVGWKILNSNHPEITINEDGLVSVPAWLEITKLEKITVYCYTLYSDDVNASLDIDIAPASASDFVGFEDNALWYYDKDMNVTSTDILRVSNTEYQAKAPIDIFEMDTREKPEGFESPIFFKPIICGENSKYMRFTTKCDVESSQPFLFNDYEEDAWTLDIPDFTVLDSTCIQASIQVHFAYDPNICLTINFNLWQNPESQTSSGLIFYVPGEGDPHDIDPVVIGNYESKLFCPDKKVTGIYSGTLSHIYVCRPKYEQPDLDIVFVKNESLPQELADAFTYSYEYHRITREFDNYSVYDLTFNYEFDLSKKQYDASKWNYANYYLLEMQCIDRFEGLDLLTCRCDFYIEWI